MTTPALNSTDALTVVVIDDGAEFDAERLLQQLVKTSPRGTERLLVTSRSHRMAPAVARQVKVVRARGDEHVASVVSAEIARPRMVLVTSGSATLSAGWDAEIKARVSLLPTNVSSIQAASSRGIQLYPAAVTSMDAPLAPWLSPRHLRLRSTSVAQQGQSASTTVSAVMIVKDEESILDECLAALAPFVDEIVVYDTGSTDTTMDIARRHGAKVIEGYWNDHFGDARNRALDHATQEWVFQIDADEVVTGDPAEFRARLAAEERDHISVAIVSSAWQGVQTGLITHPVRLFRRGSSRYVNALHEYPKPLDESRLGHTGVDAPVKLMHSGYTLGMVAEKSKGARNVAIARRELELAAPGESHSSLLSNLARSLMWDGQIDEAIKVFQELRNTTGGNDSAMVVAGRNAFDVLLSLRQLSEAGAWVRKLEEHGEVPGNLATMTARLQLAEGRVDEASAAIASFRANEDGARDPWGLTYDKSKMLALEAQLHLSQGDLEAGVARLLALAVDDPEALDLDLTLRALVVMGRPLTDLASAASEALIARSIREASLFHPSGALAWFDALHSIHPRDQRVVVAGCLFASRASWTQALAWSLRARELGVEGICALRGLGENTTMPAMERAMAWLVLAEVLGEADAVAELRLVVTQVDPADRAALADLAEQHGMDGSSVRVDGPRQVWITTDPVQAAR